jgi:redox-sensitive bicupin YhaK (pirin superfamily)
MKIRSVQAVVPAVATFEGAGFLVHRPFPSPSLDFFDPFLLLDEMGPSDLGPGEAKGAPDHPHRGFETVTYLLSGAMQHKDSQGNQGKLTPGDVQWMTAGSGVVHSEMPEPSFQEKGGRMHGFQLWVNLPARDKMTRPRYQEIPSSGIPVGKSDDGKVTVRVIAGESLGKRAVIETRTPIFYLDCALEPGASLEQPAPPEFNAFAFVYEGRGIFGANRQTARSHEAVIFDNDGDAVRIEAAPDAPLKALLIGGVPLKEQVARYGPFVMNTRQEIVQAFDDYQSGKLGEIR